MFQKPHGLKILSTYSCASQDLFHFVCSNYIIYYIQNVYVCTVVNIHIQKSFFFFLNRKPLGFLSLPCMSNVLNSLTQEEQREHFQEVSGAGSLSNILSVLAVTISFGLSYLCLLIGNVLRLQERAGVSALSRADIDGRCSAEHLHPGQRFHRSLQ